MNLSFFHKVRIILNFYTLVLVFCSIDNIPLTPAFSSVGIVLRSAADGTDLPWFDWFFFFVFPTCFNAACLLAVETLCSGLKAEVFPQRRILFPVVGSWLLVEVDQSLGGNCRFGRLKKTPGILWGHAEFSGTWTDLSSVFSPMGCSLFFSNMTWL